MPIGRGARDRQSRNAAIPTRPVLHDYRLTEPILQDPKGVMQGTNSRGSTGYVGPKPRVGDPPHHYHLQVFALDTTLTADPAMTWDQLKAALKDHVVASGEVVGLGQVDPTAPPPAPRPAG